MVCTKNDVHPKLAMANALLIYVLIYRQFL